MKRLIPWAAPAILLVLLGLYVGVPRFGLGINQVCDMLSYGNNRGLMMVFYESDFPQMVSLGIGILAYLVPLLKPQYLLAANVGFFGGVEGTLLTVAGAMLALILIGLMGTTLWAVIPHPLKFERLKNPVLPSSALLLFGFWLMSRTM